ncbi:hypothetical protein AXX17_AT2G31500 [Arabidopsis thaliana]|uniref:Uncharacterized protein n=1 Tax=Arabidopsis thaliana TaxID=3702 RepID=A0A178VRF8_ARATH|nr:hypothetical protein AXX17_AT2G31500 [Arabidopsis thaliana]
MYSVTGKAKSNPTVLPEQKHRLASDSSSLLSCLCIVIEISSSCDLVPSVKAQVLLV